MSEAVAGHTEIQDAETEDASFRITPQPASAGTSLARVSSRFSPREAQGAVVLILPFSCELTAEENAGIAATL